MFSFCFFSLKKKLHFKLSSMGQIYIRHLEHRFNFLPYSVPVSRAEGVRAVRKALWMSTDHRYTNQDLLSEPKRQYTNGIGSFLLEADSAEFNGKVVHDLKFGTTFESHWAASQPTSNYQQTLQALEHLCHLFFFIC